MILPGVQVLFAFLLVAPFNQRFADITTFQKYLYLATLLCAAGSVRLSDRAVDPASDHVPHAGQGEPRVRANRLTIVGCGLLALAMTGAIWLDHRLPVRRPRHGGRGRRRRRLFAVLWYGVPLLRRRRLQR